MDLGLTERVAILIGASKGLGKAIAIGLAREGANVAISARSKESLTDTAKLIEEKYRVTALPIAADLRNAQDLERVVAATVRKFNRVDIL
jgi:3-oxoacyl-[acyl-carrier protein] reductase